MADEGVQLQAPSPSSNGNGKADELTDADIRELGRAGGQGLWRDYNPNLTGPQALETYEQMRRGDAQVRATLRLVKTPIVSATWAVKAASNSDIDLQAAELVEWARTRLNRSWRQFLWEALLHLDYGWSAFEVVWEPSLWRPADSSRGPARAVATWRKFSPRHPRQLDHFEFDSGGGIAAIHFTKGATTNPVTGQSVFDSTPVRIPISKLLLFTFDEEGGDPTGVSLLRTMYKHWYYKEQLYKIDAIQKERHGIGVPDIELPIGYSPKDKQLAAEMGRNLRTNEKAEIVRPPGWKIGFAALSGEPVDVLRSAEHHDLMIARSVLAQFVNLGTSESGSRAVSNSMVDLFLKAQRYVAEMIAEVINQFAIPRLVDLNFNVSAYPRLVVEKIGDEADQRAFSVALRNFVEGGLITPTPEDESYFRGRLDMPLAPKAALERSAASRVRTKGSQGGAGPPESSPGSPNPANPGDTTSRTPKPADG